jgi:Lanthionine synthetase C-like protein
MTDLRYFENSYADYSDTSDVTVPQAFVRDLIKKYVKVILQNTDPKIRNINSRSRPDLYVGLSGIAFMFLKLSTSVLSHEFPALELAKNYSRNAEEILKNSRSRKYISLLSGNCGVYIVSAAVNRACEKPFEDDIRRALKGVKIFENPEYLGKFINIFCEYFSNKRKIKI